VAVMRLRQGVIAVVLTLSLLALAAAAAMPAAQARVGETGRLALRAALRITGDHNPTCPPGTPDTVECHQHTGSGLVSGLGTVMTSYSFRVDVKVSVPTTAAGWLKSARDSVPPPPAPA
jgi:hypothetical protein